MSSPILSIRGLRKRFGGITAADNLSIDIAAGEVHAVIGPNGAGKSTLIGLLSGTLRPDGGRIEFEGRDISRLSAPARARRGLARSFQITSVFADFSCVDNVSLAVQARDGHSFRFWGAAAADPALRNPAQTMLDRVGLGDRSEVLAGNLAHGEQRQLEIAMALATRPKVLLLDEPMAGMGPEDSVRMTDYLGALKGQYSMLLVEHDMDAVFALADRITVLVYGGAVATDTPQAIRRNERVRQAYLGED